MHTARTWFGLDGVTLSSGATDTGADHAVISGWTPRTRTWFVVPDTKVVEACRRQAESSRYQKWN